ncbi:hypothetical protein [Candidatus Methylomirabilis sp.]|uniref:hypothetical protein n=1 Tax=Candidatus Methylomirabilis sp. TaxID=2032687 RepID=UPI003C75A0E3
MEKQEDKNLDFEAKKLEIEQEKLKIEWEKVRVEQSKKWFTSISIFIPLLVVSISLVASSWYEKQKAEADFRIKAAEIITRFQDPDEMRGRAFILRHLFPDKLPKNFAESFDPSGFRGETHFTTKIDLLKFIIQNKEHKQEIIQMWKELFPKDTWINGIK